VSIGHLAIIGCGDIGTRVGLDLEKQGWRISALRRRAEKLPSTFEGFPGDYTRATDLLPLVAQRPTHLLFTPLPMGRDAAGYERGFTGGVDAMIEAGLADKVSFGVMVSSTRVYAESAGGWVDETSPLTTEDAAAQAIIRAENRWREALARATVARASGLYGELPGMLLSRVASGLASQDSDRISNRIHRDDVAAALVFLLTASFRETLPATLLLSDSTPTPIGEVEVWLAQQLGVSLAHSNTASAAFRGNRRCNNKLLRGLGFNLRYPSYREGYAAMLSQRSPCG
jgi:nucleoside-diphosphate-sugar epimerase